MRFTIGHSFEVERGFIRLPYFGSLYWEPSKYAQWNKLETERHDREVEGVWGRWRFINNTAAKISPIVEALGKDIWPCPHTGKTASSLAAILEAIFGHKKPFIKWEFEVMRGAFGVKNLNGHTL
ncbi:hypothetical protein SAMN02744133_105208 [Thalassospira xiamenensis M-5 = DSM 17429]|uniref:Uncharacterized protein n=1 Tax=Thalassospira xiamenensis M-5 = DSM 17429 TaxID=1123366 RepID=A0AB72UH33_9PROT|nr:hypothetical protein [Thalassospira xiamenensis]AJD53583.1 hypothetical protein TH3_17405 [Thalassospira xiamenensis M-5 = DSM 17429]SIT09325.1 hypothetical protein SAMN02744133_105208 [Thalassospira xiamenensis M-5 = DSM 17429]